MYTTIHHINAITRSIDEQVEAGQNLARTLSKKKGFIAYLLIDLGGGASASVCVFEDEARLQAALREVRGGVVAGRGATLIEGRETTEGEVIVQQGL